MRSARGSARRARREISPITLADRLEEDGMAALRLLESLSGEDLSESLSMELAEAEAGAHLSLYFADKPRAADYFQLLAKLS